MTFDAMVYETKTEAVQNFEDDGWEVVILIDGLIFGTTETDAQRLETSGKHFAYLFLHETSNRLVTVPVNN